MSIRIVFGVCALAMGCSSLGGSGDRGVARIDPLTGGAVTISAGTPPGGVALLARLQQNGDILLSRSPLCEASYEGATIRDRVSFVLGYALDEPDREVVISASCEDSRFEATEGSVENVWDCTLGADERNNAGQFVSNARIKFALRKADWGLIENSLRCY